MKKLWNRAKGWVSKHPWETATIGLVGLAVLIALITKSWAVTALLVASAVTYIVAKRRR